MLVHFEVSLPSFAFMEGMVHGVWPAGEVSPIRDGLEQDGEQNGKGVGGTRTKRAPDGTMRRVWQGLFFLIFTFSFKTDFSTRRDSR